MRPDRRPWFLIVLLTGLIATAQAQDEPKPESSYVKLLKKAPEERVGQIVDIIGKRGSAEDLAVIYQRAIAPGGFTPLVQLKALEILADAALTRDVRPQLDTTGLGRLMFGSASGNVRLAAIKLAGLWKAEPTLTQLLGLAEASESSASIRSAAFDAIARIDSPSARESIQRLSASSRPANVRALAIAGLSRFDLDQAASKAVGLLTNDARIEDVTPLVAAFLDRQGGGERLASALKDHPPTADGARLALRAVYALGRSDESLIAVLSKTAGIEAEPRLPTREEMDALVQEVGSKGNSERGEAIFRRGELNCMKCHAIAGAAGGVGPELSSLGLSSPVDYVVNSILIPDQAIKEEYQTRQVLTDDGRVLQGIVIEEDDKRLVLKDATGEKRVIPISSIEDSKKGGSLMPKGLATLLTRAEFVDLVRFLSELGKPGPYALRSTPTIQRWRLLKSSPDGIAGVLQADPGQWTTLYGQMNGALPLEEVVAPPGERSAYLQGEIAVSAPGPIRFRFNSSKGVTAWVDDQPLPVGDSGTIEVGEGTHKLTLRVEIAARDAAPIRVDVEKPAGTSAEFSVVGGR